MVLFGEQFSHLTISAHKHGIKADDLAIIVERNAVDIFNQPFGESWRTGGAREQSECA